MAVVDRRILSQFDWGLFSLMLILPLLSLIVMYSAGYDPDGRVFSVDWLGITIESVSFVKQATYFGLGFIVMLVAMCVPPQFYYKYSWLFYFLCIISLAAVFVFGQVSHGSRRWFSLGIVNFQPSEMMKLAMVLVMARYLSRNPPPPGGYNFWKMIPSFIIFGVPMLLIVKQPDLGTALSIGAIGFSMVLFMGIRVKHLIWMGVISVGSIFPLWFLLAPYQKRRVLTLFNPEADPLGSGYHIIQSKIAVGSGGFTGKGYLEGTQSQLEFLPEHTTDFVFSVLAEEWGFIGCLLVLTVYFLFLYRLLRVALRSKDTFSALVAFGVAFYLFFHAFINIGMVIGILPVVGLPLPLFSYGGSSAIIIMAAVGVVMGISMRRLVFSAGSMG